MPKKRTVKQNDNYFKLAEEIYGDQRFAGLLIDANKGRPLHAGTTLRVPDKPQGATGQNVFFSNQAAQAAADLDAAVGFDRSRIAPRFSEQQGQQQRQPQQQQRQPPPTPGGGISSGGAGANVLNTAGPPGPGTPGFEYFEDYLNPPAQPPGTPGGALPNDPTFVTPPPVQPPPLSPLAQQYAGPYLPQAPTPPPQPQFEPVSGGRGTVVPGPVTPDLTQRAIDYFLAANPEEDPYFSAIPPGSSFRSPPRPRGSAQADRPERRRPDVRGPSPLPRGPFSSGQIFRDPVDFAGNAQGINQLGPLTQAGSEVRQEPDRLFSPMIDTIERGLTLGAQGVSAFFGGPPVPWDPTNVDPYFQEVSDAQTQSVAERTEAYLTASANYYTSGPNAQQYMTRPPGYSATVMFNGREVPKTLVDIKEKVENGEEVSEWWIPWLAQWGLIVPAGATPAIDPAGGGGGGGGGFGGFIPGGRGRGGGGSGGSGAFFRPVQRSGSGGFGGGGFGFPQQQARDLLRSASVSPARLAQDLAREQGVFAGFGLTVFRRG